MNVLAKGIAAPLVGVIAMQGDFDAHLKAVEAAGGRAILARTAEQVAACDALILPGGESTTIGKLLSRYGIDTAIHAANTQGKPIFGTCAGLILLAKRIVQGEMRGGQQTLGLMDVGVVRNAFGRQVDSFETDIDTPEVAGGAPIRGVFIRAPLVAEAGSEVTVLGTYQGETVLIRQRNLLAAAFHPELTDDTRLHRYFLQMVNAPETAEKETGK